jgi:hypothetical protein
MEELYEIYIEIIELNKQKNERLTGYISGTIRISENP